MLQRHTSPDGVVFYAMRARGTVCPPRTMAVWHSRSPGEGRAERHRFINDAGVDVRMSRHHAIQHVELAVKITDGTE